MNVCVCARARIYIYICIYGSIVKIYVHVATIHIYANM